MNHRLIPGIVCDRDGFLFLSRRRFRKASFLGRAIDFFMMQVMDPKAYEAGYREVVELYDPLARGHVKSLARPSGNVTRVFLQQVELAGGWLFRYADRDGILRSDIGRPMACDPRRWR
jgi:hypothetical protein